MDRSLPQTRPSTIVPKSAGTWDDIVDTPFHGYESGSDRPSNRKARERARPSFGNTRPLPVAPRRVRAVAAPTLLQKIVGGVVVLALLVVLIVLVRLMFSVLVPGLVVLGLGMLCVHLLKPR